MFLAGQEFCRNHFGLQQSDLSHTIPLVVHIDAGPVTRDASAKYIQWGSLLGLGAGREIHYLAASWMGDADQTPLFDRLNDSWKILAAGRDAEGTA